MVRLDGGLFLMGSDLHYPEEAPMRPMAVPGFLIDPVPVTNRAFAAFVENTGHFTAAERAGGSWVFVPPEAVPDMGQPDWWRFVPGADWKHPEGPQATLDGRDDCPVVHVSHGDALAFAAWAGKALPNEAEWEFAARGGVDTTFSWGNESRPGGRAMANVWDGEFPHGNLKPHPPAPQAVRSYPPNGFGLYDMLGNVWEWTCDVYREPGDAGRCAGAKGDGPEMVVKGGSFLCADDYCFRYRPTARQPQAAGASACHIGFRCVRR